MPNETVEGTFWHHPDRDGRARRCSQCLDPQFRHSYGPFRHAHWVGGETGHYMVCNWRACSRAGLLPID